MFSRSAILREKAGNVDDAMTAFNRYKKTIPVYGAILLDSERGRGISELKYVENLFV